MTHYLSFEGQLGTLLHLIPFKVLGLGVWAREKL